MKRMTSLIAALTPLFAFSCVGPEFYAQVEKKLEYSYQAVQTSKEIALTLFKELKEEGTLQKRCDDGTLQPFFANIERSVLDTLLLSYSQGKIGNLIGVIHQDHFFIPLCFDLTEYDADLNQAIKSKGEMLKSYLESRALLYHLYPKGSREALSNEEAAFYQKNLELFPFNFCDLELDSIAISGVTFLFECEGKKWAFCIDFPKSREGESELVMWLDEIESNSSIKDRVDLAVKMLDSSKISFCGTNSGI